MSAINGDKSRFHKKRKSKIARRQRYHSDQLLKPAPAPPQAPASPRAKAKP